MEKLQMKTHDASEGNVAKIAALFPQCVTERIGKDGTAELAIDFDKLRNELSKNLLDGAEERYQFTWPDKRAASRLANEETDKTLRPDLDASEDFWNTENLYIEGDNLDVLKVLRENYLGKVKMIYIDPPYNTGNDFVYNDDFAQGKDEFEQSNGLFDEDGNQVLDPMQRNTESNGRFHTDWLNMIYPRLKVARDILSNDGMIFISIDDNEVDNLRKLCDEIFGESNYVASFIWEKKKKPSFLNSNLGNKTEYVLAYAKHRQNTSALSVDVTEVGKKYPINNAGNTLAELTFPANSVKFNMPDGKILPQDMSEGNIVTELLNEFTILGGRNVEPFTLRGEWRYSQSTLNDIVNNGDAITISKIPFRPNHIKSGGEIKKIHNLLAISTYNVGTNEDATSEQVNIFGKTLFDFTKPLGLLKFLVKAFTFDSKDAIILDFFSGSSTTAHAVMKLNAEEGGKRKFIMVQLPEVTDEKSEARKAGYDNICQIGEERIRRAGKKILEEVRSEKLGVRSDKAGNLFGQEDSSQLTSNSSLKDNSSLPDVGFRVLKLDSSNMEDVFYTPEDFDAQNIFTTVDNVKSDRTPLDLLFQVLPELNIELSAKIEEKEVNGKKVFFVDGNYLIATFDTEVNESTVTEIAKMKPQYFVMRDASAANDNVLDNFEQIFRHYSPDTIRKIL